jgi:non-heme chloroperoxidase
VPPLMLQTPANPGGLPLNVFDGIRSAMLADRSQFFKDLTMPFYGIVSCFLPSPMMSLVARNP